MDSLGLNTYAYIQVVTGPSENSTSVISSCCLSNPHPTWNETFQFEVKKLHPKGFMTIHFMGTLDKTPQTQLVDPGGSTKSAGDHGEGIDQQKSMQVGGIDLEKQAPKSADDEATALMNANARNYLSESELRNQRLKELRAEAEKRKVRPIKDGYDLF